MNLMTGGECVRGIGVTQDITQRKQKELIQSAKLRLIDASSSRTSEELLIIFLDETEYLTESENGFYHVINEDQNTLSLQTWSTRTINTFCSAGPSAEHCPLSEAGAWAESFRKRKPIINNSYINMPIKNKFPQGHATIYRQLTVPVFRGNKIVAILGVGNKKTDYTSQDIEIVQELADLSWETISLKIANEALQKSERRFRMLFEQAPIGIDLVSPQGIPILANKALVNMLGYSEKELYSKPFTTWTHYG